jgi:hypothetical protein
MTTENNSKPTTREADGLGEPLQLELPELFLEVGGEGALSFGGADVISKSDLAMMRGRRKRHDQQERNKR